MQRPYVPYVRLQPDWHLVLQESLSSRSDSIASSSADFKDEIARHDIASVVEINGQGGKYKAFRPKPKFWISAYFGGESWFEEIEIKSATPTENVTNALNVDFIKRSFADELWALTNSTADFQVDFLSPRRLRLSVQAKELTISVNVIAPVACYDNIHPAVLDRDMSALRAAPRDIFSIDISPDGLWGASGSRDGQVRVWSASTGQLFRDLSARGHVGDVTLVRWFPSSQVLLTGSVDSQLKIWAVADRNCAATLRGHSGSVVSAHMIDRGRHVVSASTDGTAKMWDCGTQQAVSTFTPEIGRINSSLLLNVQSCGCAMSFNFFAAN